jgi:hypothetical protein
VPSQLLTIYHLAEYRHRKSRVSEKNFVTSNDMSTEGSGDVIASLITLSKSVEARCHRHGQQNFIRGLEHGKRKRDNCVNSRGPLGELRVSRDGENLSADYYPFQTDSDDHCETPIEAYCDISVFLESVGKSLGKSKESIIVYDPYFCEGKGTPF